MENQLNLNGYEIKNLIKFIFDISLAVMTVIFNIQFNRIIHEQGAFLFSFFHSFVSSEKFSEVRTIINIMKTSP